VIGNRISIAGPVQFSGIASMEEQTTAAQLISVQNGWLQRSM